MLLPLFFEMLMIALLTVSLLIRYVNANGITEMMPPCFRRRFDDADADY